MHSLTLKYEDWDGNPREKTCYFNISTSEAMKLQMSSSGGLVSYLEKIIEDQDWPLMSDYFEKFLLFTYGEKSLDGERFEKSDEISAKFKATKYYDILYTRLTTDAKFAAEFFNAVIPKDLPQIEEDAPKTKEEVLKIMENAQKS